MQTITAIVASRIKNPPIFRSLLEYLVQWLPSDEIFRGCLETTFSFIVSEAHGTFLPLLTLEKTILAFLQVTCETVSNLFLAITILCCHTCC